jgi:hypothetical protein
MRARVRVRAYSCTQEARYESFIMKVAITVLGPVALILACLITVLGAGWMLAPLLAG